MCMSYSTDICAPFRSFALTLPVPNTDISVLPILKLPVSNTDSSATFVNQYNDYIFRLIMKGAFIQLPTCLMYNLWLWRRMAQVNSIKSSRSGHYAQGAQRKVVDSVYYVERLTVRLNRFLNDKFIYLLSTVPRSTKESC